MGGKKSMVDLGPMVPKVDDLEENDPSSAINLSGTFALIRDNRMQGSKPSKTNTEPKSDFDSKKDKSDLNSSHSQDEVARHQEKFDIVKGLAQVNAPSLLNISTNQILVSNGHDGIKPSTQKPGGERMHKFKMPPLHLHDQGKLKCSTIQGRREKKPMVDLSPTVCVSGNLKENDTSSSTRLFGNFGKIQDSRIQGSKTLTKNGDHEFGFESTKKMIDLYMVSDKSPTIPKLSELKENDLSSPTDLTENFGKIRGARVHGSKPLMKNIDFKFDSDLKKKMGNLDLTGDLTTKVPNLSDLKENDTSPSICLFRILGKIRYVGMRGLKPLMRNIGKHFDICLRKNMNNPSSINDLSSTVPKLSDLKENDSSSSTGLTGIFSLIRNARVHAKKPPTRDLDF